MDTLIPAIIRLINSKAGGIVQNAAGAVLGWLFFHGLRMSPETAAEVQGIFVMAGMAAVTSVVQWLQSVQVGKMQAALGVKVDYWIGRITIAAAAAKAAFQARTMTLMTMEGTPGPGVQLGPPGVRQALYGDASPTEPRGAPLGSESPPPSSPATPAVNAPPVATGSPQP